MALIGVSLVGQSARKQVDTALHSGKGFVLVVTDGRMHRADDEAYGDWAENLNRFAGPKPIKVTRLTYTRLFAEPKLRSAFATIFVRDANHALVYDGMAMERVVYQDGTRYLKGEEVSEAGLVETRIRLLR